MVVTPGDILGRCRALSARMDAATAAIESAKDSEIDQSFRSSWTERLRRWQPIREQCGDWASRWWNYKWGPILDDWEANQVQWEKLIEQHTKRTIPVPQQIKPDEDPTLPSLPKPSTSGVAIALGAAVVLGAFVLLRKS